MPKNGRRDQIQKSGTEKQGNDMYKDAESGKATGEIADGNKFYDTVKYKNDPDIVRGNKIYNGEIDPDDSSDDEE